MNALQHRLLPHEVYRRSGYFNPSRDTITVLTMHVYKWLELQVVACSHIPAAGTNEQKEARLFYVAATQASHRLVIIMSGIRHFGPRLI